MTLHGEPSPGFVYDKNITIRGPKGYGVFGDATGEGNTALKKFAPSCSFRKNVIVGAPPAQYPSDNFYPTSTTEVGFVAFEKGDFRLNPTSRYKKAGDEEASLGCNFELLPKLSR